MDANRYMKRIRLAKRWAKVERGNEMRKTKGVRKGRKKTEEVSSGHHLTQNVT